MSLSDSAETDLLKLLFQNVTWAGVGDATGVVGSTTAGSIYIAVGTGSFAASQAGTSGGLLFGGGSAWVALGGSLRVTEAPLSAHGGGPGRLGWYPSSRGAAAAPPPTIVPMGTAHNEDQTQPVTSPQRSTRGAASDPKPSD